MSALASAPQKDGPEAAPRPEDVRPIFIVGAPRSGTSLLRNLLNRHSAIALCNETYFFYYVYTRRRTFGDLADASARRRLIDRYLATTRIRRLGLDAGALADALARAGTTYPNFFLALLEFFTTARGKRRCGEKTPQHALFAETLCAWYPHAKLIHLVRDPRDVVASLMHMPWSRSSVLFNARAWRRHTVAAARCERQTGCLQVRYEELVTHPEAELKHICAFIGEDYEPRMLAAAKEPEADAWWFDRARRTVDRGRIGLWRDQLSRRQVSIIEWATAPHLERFGYEPSGSLASLATVAGAVGRDVLEFVPRQISRIPQMWYHYLQPANLAAEEAWIDRRGR